MNLGLIKTGLSIVGRVTGVLPVEASGEPVKARKGRLVALLVVLGSSIGMWLGLPEPIAQALADVLVEFGEQAVQ
jgi:hypothetical protein|tara:strand:+ start:284 stop:508 length:225 start_codon:yes stop_codon:yes gene_type:complete